MPNVRSVKTIKDPEFINLEPTDLNSGLTKCQIKVLYTGENRNGSFIKKDVAIEMSKTLRGAPIVGYYLEEKEDFRDHGDQLIIDSEGIRFNVLTKPYGFVAPDAEVWFQEYEEVNDFGETITREYMMTTGYLWTKQFEEAGLVTTEGRPQSMEIDNVSAHWAQNTAGVDFCIIDDAEFSKLCILGSDVEPCFEGAEITKFTKDTNEFTKSLYTMFKELEKVLKGGETSSMETEKFEVEEPAAPVEEPIEPVEESVEPTKPVEELAEESVESTEESIEPIEEPVEPEETPTDAGAAFELQEVTNKLNEVTVAFEKLQSEYENLQSEYSQLAEFKRSIENEKKDKMIESFYMLSDEDKKDVIENKEKYSLDEIEAKLSIVFTKQRMELERNSQGAADMRDGFCMTLGAEEDNVPDWIKAVRAIEKSL